MENQIISTVVEVNHTRVYLDHESGQMWAECLLGKDLYPEQVVYALRGRPELAKGYKWERSKYCRSTCLAVPKK